MPVSVLVDYDPDGAHIFRMYAEGGLKNTTPVLAHARWAGLHCSCGRIGNWGLDPESTIEFTAHDRRLSLHLVKEWEKSTGLRRRMAKMAYRGKKVELEAITQFRSMLLAYIDHILSDCD
ncbi:hypothetical protein EV177_004726 [Coemansia sp. RSA 1804]|nr:hypothetical protein EV177_004726 [Coemansia sp. RSA 1804]